MDVQAIYGKGYYIDPIPTIFSGRPESWYFYGTLRYRTETHWVFDNVKMMVYQADDQEFYTDYGNNVKFEIDKFKLNYN
jgi:hypothetical protein